MSGTKHVVITPTSGTAPSVKFTGAAGKRDLVLTTSGAQTISVTWRVPADLRIGILNAGSEDQQLVESTTASTSAVTARYYDWPDYIGSRNLTSTYMPRTDANHMLVDGPFRTDGTNVGLGMAAAPQTILAINGKTQLLDNLYIGAYSSPYITLYPANGNLEMLGILQVATLSDGRVPRSNVSHQLIDGPIRANDSVIAVGGALDTSYAIKSYGDIRIADATPRIDLLDTDTSTFWQVSSNNQEFTGLHNDGAERTWLTVKYNTHSDSKQEVLLYDRVGIGGDADTTDALKITGDVDVTGLAAGGMVKATATSGKLAIATQGTDYANGSGTANTLASWTSTAGALTGSPVYTDGTVVAVGSAVNTNYKMLVTGYGGDATDHIGLVVGGTYGDQTAHPMQVRSTHPLAEDKAVAAYDSQVATSGTHGVNHIVSFQSRASHGSSGTCKILYGYYTRNENNGGLCDVSYGAYIANPQGSGSITDCYGIYIEDQTKAARNSYAVYTTGSAKSVFGAQLVVSPTNSGFTGLPTAPYIASDASSLVLIPDQTGTNTRGVKVYAYDGSSYQLAIDVQNRTGGNYPIVNLCSKLDIEKITASAPFVAGARISTASDGLNILPSRDGGAGDKVIFTAYNGSASVSVFEYANVASGAVVAKFLQDGGFTVGAGSDFALAIVSDNVELSNQTQDKDIVLKGNDGGSTITAMTVDMSDAGALLVNSLSAGGMVKATASTGKLTIGVVGTDYANGTGTTNIVSKWTGTGTLGDSIIRDDGTVVAVGAAVNTDYKVLISGSGSNATDHIGLVVGGTYGDQTAHPMQVRSVHPLAEDNAVAAYDSQVASSGTHGVNHIVSFQSRASHGSSGTCRVIYGYYTRNENNGGLCETSYGAYIANPQGSGNITDCYGIYIEDQAKAARNDYAIYTAGNAKSYISGLAMSPTNAGFTGLPTAPYIASDASSLVLIPDQSGTSTRAVKVYAYDGSSYQLAIDVQNTTGGNYPTVNLVNKVDIEQVTASGAFVAGGRISTLTNGLNILPSRDGGAGDKVVFAAYNGTAFVSVLEYANVASGSVTTDITGIHRVGGPSTNYTQFDDTGHQTMVGTAKPWDDLRIEPVARTTGANAPTFEQWADDGGLGDTGTTRGIYLYSFDDASAGSEKEVFFTMQMPHGWDGGHIDMHVHWIGAVADTTAAPRWGLEYAWKEIGATFGATATIIYTDGKNYTPVSDDTDITAGKHYLSKFADITPGATADGISSILIGRLFRDSANAADTYNAAGAKCGLLYIDAHFQLNSLGSTDEYTK